MADEDEAEAAASVAGDEMVDEVVVRLLDRADASGRPCPARAGC